MTEMLKRLSGEELLLLRILNGDGVASAISAELDRKALGSPGRTARTERYWAGRNFASRHSARAAA